MANIYLVSCVSKKKPGPCAAKDIYISHWFKKARAYAENAGDAWYILSAYYGLLHPDRVVSSYNITLNRMSLRERRAWADGVLRELRQVLRVGDKVVILAGQRYRQFLEDGIRALGVSVGIPMEGLRIGEQLRWLNRAIP